jgi:hypothetical protein
LASHSNAELQQLQRGFVQEMLAIVEAEDDRRTSEAMKQYSTSVLAHHVKAAITLPLASDQMARELVLHSNDSVVFQVLLGIPALSDVVLLAEHFSTTNDHWSAARVYNTLSLRWRGLPKPEKLKLTKLSSQSLQRIQKKQQTAASLILTVRLSIKMFMVSDKESDILEAEGTILSVMWLHDTISLFSNAGCNNW